MTTDLYLAHAPKTYLLFVPTLQHAVKHADRVNRSRRYFYCSLDWDLL